MLPAVAAVYFALVYSYLVHIAVAAAAV